MEHKIDWRQWGHNVSAAFRPLPRGMPPGAMGYALTIYVIRAIVAVATVAAVIVAMSASQ